jgi:hypothetical protein
VNKRDRRTGAASWFVIFYLHCLAAVVAIFDTRWVENNPALHPWEQSITTLMSDSTTVNVSGFREEMLDIPVALLPVLGHRVVHRKLSCLRLLTLGLLIIVSERNRVVW